MFGLPDFKFDPPERLSPPSDWLRHIARMVHAIYERTEKMALDLTHLVAASARASKDLTEIAADLKAAIAANDPAATAAVQAQLETIASNLDAASVAAEAVLPATGATGPAPPA